MLCSEQLCVMRMTFTLACSKAWKTLRALPLVPAKPIPETVSILMSDRVLTPNILSVRSSVRAYILVPLSVGKSVLSRYTGIFFSIAGRMAGG